MSNIPINASVVYDLHTHSHCSDGALAPEALVQLAYTQGVQVLALTDHDNIDGIAQAQVAATNKLRIIPGIELSCQWQGKSIHIVGLQIDITSPILLAAIAKQRELRQTRARTIAQRLEKAGIKGAWQGALHYAQEGVIGRPHFAKYMVEAGYSRSINQAFKQYLGSGKIGDVKDSWPQIETAVSWIVQAGGIATLAHPDKYRLTRTRLRQLIELFTQAGGQAIEVVSGRQEAQVTQQLHQLAVEFKLWASCGSDFHSPEQPWQMLGEYSPLPEGCEPVWLHFHDR